MATTKPPKDGAKAFERALPELSRVARPTPLRADPALALHNVTRGVETVMRHEIRIRRELPNVDVKALRKLPDLAQAVVFAAAEAGERAASPKNAAVEARLSRARELRDILLTSAESLISAGVVPSGDVSKVRSGLGPLDSAKDCVALAALFRKHAGSVKGKTPVNRALVEEAEELGTGLLEQLKATNGKPAAGAARAPRDMVGARDKLWTLLLQRHDALWRVGAYLFGREVDRHVPPLQSSADRKPSSKRR